MRLSDAAVYLEAGRRIRRHAWPLNMYIFNRQGSVAVMDRNGMQDRWRPWVLDLVAYDWEVISGEP